MVPRLRTKQEAPPGGYKRQTISQYPRCPHSPDTVLFFSTLRFTSKFSGVSVSYNTTVCIRGITAAGLQGQCNSLPLNLKLPHIAVPQAPAAKRASASPWRRTRSCMALGHAPIDQNCPQSRTRLTPCFRRIWGAANAAGASEAGGWKRDQESASLSRNLRAMVRSEIGTRLRVCYS